MTRRDADNRDADDRDADNRDVDAVDSAAATGHGARLSTRRRGLVNRLAVFPTNGVHVLGLSSNGLLSVISLVVGRRADRRGASTVTVTVGAAFGLSGMANVLVLDTPLTYSRAACPTSSSACSPQRVLSFLGGYGRFTGGLLLSNPYQQGTP